MIKVKPYLIAETAYTFEGDKSHLLSQVKSLDKRIDAIKFHMLINPNEYIDKEHTLYPKIEKWTLSKSDWNEILSVAIERNFDIIVLVDDLDSISFLENYKTSISGIEVHAACTNDVFIMEKAAKFCYRNNISFFLGISGYEIQELEKIYRFIRENNVQKIVFMYGFQNYPTNYEKINLRKIKLYEEIFDVTVGYADHTEYNDNNKNKIIECAYVLGSNIIEVHYTSSNSKQRTDGITAYDSEELVNLKNELTLLDKVLGEKTTLLNYDEKKYSLIRKSPVYKTSFSKGECIYLEDIKFIRKESIESDILGFFEIENYFGIPLKMDVEENAEVKKSHFIEFKR